MTTSQTIAQKALEHAKKLGMHQAEVSIHQGTGLSINVRLGELETVEKHNDAQLSVTVYKDHKTGVASSADLSQQGLQDTVAAAASIAGFTEADDCLGLADKERMATEFPDLALYHPWQQSEQELVQLALQCEQSALDYDDRITNSEGASVSSYSGHSVYANTHGFSHETQASRHSLSCSVIGQEKDSMQRDYWYDSNRNPTCLQDAQQLGAMAAQRTVRRLQARKVPSCEVPVIYEAAVAKSLFGHLFGAIKGGAIYKKASFMLDKLEQQVLPDFVTVNENPHLLGGAGSASFDQEGVATLPERTIVEQGRLMSYVLGSYTARKLNLSSTANSGGVRNISVTNTGQALKELVSDMGRGLLVTELIGSGINSVTGDYSRGAAGFWVENGEIQYPVEEITIAGNLLSMYQQIAAIGNDIDRRGNTQCGSILLEKMTIAGS